MQSCSSLKDSYRLGLIKKDTESFMRKVDDGGETGNTDRSFTTTTTTKSTTTTKLTLTRLTFQNP